MQGCKPLYKQTCHVMLTAEENPFPWDENIIENDEGLSSYSPKRISGIDPLLKLPLFIGLAAKNENDPRRIKRKCTGQSVVFILLSHRLGGHDQNFVGIDASGHMGLGTSNNNSIRPAFYDMCKKIWVCLFAGCERSVSFGIGHPAYDHHIGVLNVDQILLKSFEIIGLIFLINIITCHVGGI